VQQQQHRLAVVVAADGHPLLDSADRDERGFLDTVCGNLCVHARGEEDCKGNK
jgi:hypothetical protein